MNHALERTHAPHVDPEWTNAFIVEARLANLDGTTIGDALAEIDAHVVSSGESAKATFGDPRSYARRWPPAPVPAPRRRWVPSQLLRHRPSE